LKPFSSDCTAPKGSNQKEEGAEKGRKKGKRRREEGRPINTLYYHSVALFSNLENKRGEKEIGGGEKKEGERGLWARRETI